jgi:hypothetical protein
MESDWKKFSAMIPMLRERYLATQNAKAASLLTDPRRNETKRFWDAMELMEKEAKVLRRCLDGHSRSKMEFFMMDMIGHGMLKEEDLAGFSEELRGRFSRFFPGK